MDLASARRDRRVEPETARGAPAPTPHASGAPLQNVAKSRHEEPR
jgi:hypothetical protein